MAADLNLLEKPKAGILAVFRATAASTSTIRFFSVVFKSAIISAHVGPTLGNSHAITLLKQISPAIWRASHLRDAG